MQSFKIRAHIKPKLLLGLDLRSSNSKDILYFIKIGIAFHSFYCPFNPFLTKYSLLLYNRNNNYTDSKNY